MSVASRAILSNYFEEQCNQNHPQYLSGMSLALFPTNFLEIAVCIYSSWQVHRLFSNKKNKYLRPVSKRNGSNFPHLQPMAELRKDRKGEIGRQHVTEHYVAASVYVWFHLSHPDQ